MNFPWSKPTQNTQRKKFTGLSSKPKLPALPKKPATKEPISIDLPALRPYLAVVRNDIARIFQMDDKSMEQEEIYNDFMKEHFPKE